MDEDHHNVQDQIAPLQIREPSRAEEHDGRLHDTETSNFDPTYLPRPRFQNFLRAAYPFHPAATPSLSTVTLRLNAGDIVLVHSVHTNGWADGTLLETGARGWLPTNYCEPYDYAAMRPLLKAVTEFWDMIRSGNEADSDLFNSHDYMRGMVAGVRFLLEKSDCLTRDSRLVRKHDLIRKVRKMLLADLSSLVRSAKQTQQLLLIGSDPSDVDELLDQMLLKAFQVVTRAVNFFDCWSEEAALAHEAAQNDAAVTTRADSMRHSRFASLGAPADALDDAAHMIVGPMSNQARPQTLTIHTSKPSLAHRMSYTGRALQPYLIENLASEKLNETYDAFLGVLASFLGSHMQSRSSSELLLTTHQAVKACRRLLGVVEAIAEHGAEDREDLLEAKDAMYDNITDLVLAAKQVFRPLHNSDSEMMYLPSEGSHLVSAATACVSSAGRCVARARAVLEDMGDFELAPAMISEQVSPVETRSYGEDFITQENSIHPTEMDSPDGSDASSQAQQEMYSPQSDYSPLAYNIQAPDTMGWAAADEVEDERPTSTNSSINDALTEEGLPGSYSRLQLSRAFSRGAAHSTISESTLVSSVRDSGPSFVSDTSTRATSPERNQKPLPSTPDLVQDGSISLTDGMEDDENEIMELRFGHELMVNAEGRVVGGTMNATIEQLTRHDSTPDAFFVSTIFLTFRLFTTPQEFAKGLSHRFEYVQQTPRIAHAVQLRVYNIFKGWLESHWRHDSDEVALPAVVDFAQQLLVPTMPAVGQQLLDLARLIRDTHQCPNPRSLAPAPGTAVQSAEQAISEQPAPAMILSKSQSVALKAWRTTGSSISILDFDPLEIARQITIKKSTLFCSIVPEELLSTESTKKSDSQVVSVRAMAQLSTDLTNLVVDSILVNGEAKKRAATIKQWIKVANKCLELNNYDTLMAIICSINSSNILRLQKTWDLVSQKTKNCFEGLKHVVDVSKNYSTLRQRISGHVPPCLPFVGMYLTDLTFVDHGNPSTRQLKAGDESISVINLDKYMKTTKIVADFQRFQVPYRLTEVPELQAWLQDELVKVRASGERDFQNHYRQSLRLEPREAAQPRPATTAFSSFTGKDKFDFLAWTHMGKTKTSPVIS